MKKLIYTILILTSLSSAAVAQEVYSSTGKPLNRSQKNVQSDKLVEPSRFIFGGWGLFGMGSGIINVGATPIVGYRISDEFSAGIGFGYQYLRIRDYNSVITDVNTGAEEARPLNAHIYSPSVWMRYVIWSNIFAHVEYEQNIFSQTVYDNDFTKYPYPIIKKNESLSVPCLLAGGGIRQPISQRTSLVIMLLYDVLQDKNSPYANTLAIRFGINVGF
ncbi:MAG: hypothetical protein H6551_09030 [Chitinophagales bacterium]|nr:hypothetical protein [Chitinophagaceae bacterium]MCB9065265.1 hypothetical protein [Chitinophagales bacterium]